MAIRVANIALAVGLILPHGSFVVVAIHPSVRTDGRFFFVAIPIGIASSLFTGMQPIHSLSPRHVSPRLHAVFVRSDFIGSEPVFVVSVQSSSYGHSCN